MPHSLIHFAGCTGATHPYSAYRVHLCHAHTYPTISDHHMITVFFPLIYALEDSDDDDDDDDDDHCNWVQDLSVPMHLGLN